MSVFCIPCKVYGSHLFVRAKIIDLEVTSIVALSLKDLPIPIPREIIERLFKGELLSPFIDFLLLLGLFGEISKGKTTTIPGVKRFSLGSEGLFLVDTGATTTAINLKLLPYNLQNEISREIPWGIKSSQMGTATNIVNVPICKATIKIDDKTLSLENNPIVNIALNHHILGMDVLTSLGKTMTFDFNNQRLCISE